MTLVIRSADTLTTPPDGSKVLPELTGVTGILGRFNADHFTGAHGATVTSWADASDAARDLTSTTGTLAATQDTWSLPEGS